MTIEELRARKRDLLARKKYEQALLDSGQGDRLALFMVNEELLDVSARLRALTVGRRSGGGKTSAGWAADRQQYRDWRQADTAEENGDVRARLGRAAVHGLELLPERQREMMELYLSGLSGDEIAAALGVHKSTVSRTLARARKRIRAETERAMAAAQLRDGSARVDLRDTAAAGAVLLALTPKQTVYFYLYYSECLTLREIGALTGTDHAAVLRALRRALRNIGKLLGAESETVLEHPEALDELAYQAYCQIEDHPELLPEGAPGPARCGTDRPPRVPGPPRALPPPCLTVRRRKRREPGKLLSALLARRGEPGGVPVLRWLEAVFEACVKGLRALWRKERL